MKTERAMTGRVDTTAGMVKANMAEGMVSIPEEDLVSHFEAVD